jgi:DedD protein
MEKKKLLLVAVSVGVFLVIIISASILIFTPKAVTALSSARPAPPGAAFLSQPATIDPSDLVRNSENFQEIQPPPERGPVTESRFYVSGEQLSPAPTVSGGEIPVNIPANITINVPPPSAAAVPEVPLAVTAAPPPVESVTVRPAPAAPPKAPAAAPKPSPKPAAAVVSAKPATAKPAPPAATAKPAAAKSAAQTQTYYNDYWVQTGAFTTKVRAEGVKDTLASKGITSIIENREIDGKTWYRVRVGPYTSETEANYWLTLVQSIDGFANSQVRQTRSLR